jgi:fermentation-respiration switch protein FrsA (DUF1100 family)
MRTTVLLTILAFLPIFPDQACGQFYHPDHQVYTTPDKQGLNYETVTFTSRDGTKLSGWFVPATRPAIGTVIHFHGNAQNMSAHFSFVAWLPQEGFNVFVFDYRGYGQSEGSAKRKGIHEDSIAALKYIKSRKDIAQDRLLVFGQSLGGANAIDAVTSAKLNGIRGVAIDSAFYSYRSVAKDKAPGFLVDVFIGDDYSPGPVIAKISPIPLLIMHGTADAVVPYTHGKNLFAAAKEPKSLWTIDGAGHTEAIGRFGATYRPKLVEFFTSCLAQKPTR